MQRLKTLHSVSTQNDYINDLKQNNRSSNKLSNKLAEIRDIGGSFEERQYPLPVEYMQLKLRKDVKKRYKEKLDKLNEELNPRFKLSRIDLEDVVNLKTFHSEAKRECSRTIVEPDDPEILIRKIKYLRRIEYWKRRVKNDIMRHSRSHSSYENS